MPGLLDIAPTQQQPQCSRFPGEAQLKWNIATGRKEITLVKGTIIYTSRAQRVQYVQPRAKWVGFWKGGVVHLIGDSYLRVCLHCKASICGAAVPNVETLVASGLPFEEAIRRPTITELMETGLSWDEARLEGSHPRCPYCFKFLTEPREGDKVVIHYRFKNPTRDQEGNCIDPGWGMWFAERRDWT